MDKSQQILSDIVVFQKYAKYDPVVSRRETWEELCYRNQQMHIKKYPELKDEIKQTYKDYVVTRKVLPSMRSMQFAGNPIELSNNRIFNCAFTNVDDIAVFNETMFNLLSGSGVGYSVQKQHVAKLPTITGPNNKTRRFLISDNIEGWADAVKVLIKAYTQNKADPIFDFRDIRPKGAALVTSGGKAPGPDPLRICLDKIRSVLNTAIGRKLEPIECHDILCHIADAVLAGGIRRAACIVLFSKDDMDMLYAKSGAWWELNPQRGRANNSVALERGNVSKEEWDKIWAVVKNSKSGEPGVVWLEDIDSGVNPCCFSGDMQLLTDEGYQSFKELAQLDSVKIMNPNGNLTEGKVWLVGKRDVVHIASGNGCRDIICTADHIFKTTDGREVQAKDVVGEKIACYGIDQEYIFFTAVTPLDTQVDVYDFTEPETHWGIVEGCIVHNSEIGLRSNQFCNLTEVNVSDVVTQEELNSRVKAGAFIGTLQAGYTDFHYLRDIWKHNSEEESLIGVGMTGIASGGVLNLNLKEAAETVNCENKRVADIIGINPAARTTCIKPSGSTSCVVGSSSGIHAWHNDYYIRRVRVGKQEALYKYLKENMPTLVEDCVFKPHIEGVVSIPQKAPYGSVLRNESVQSLLERVKRFNTEWIAAGHNSGKQHHNVSCTVSIKEDEWEYVGNWMWDNKDNYTGISVLPFFEHTYQQAPFEDCSEEEFDYLYSFLQDIDLSKVIEVEDNTNLTDQAACSGGACEIK